ncbi:hypothetical protein M728_001482 [Ensifer sp. WSM1721]
MAWLSCILNDCCKPKKTAYHTQLMHLWWLLLPVPPQQLFPSGGSYYLHNYKGPSFLVALFFCLVTAAALSCEILTYGY